MGLSNVTYGLYGGAIAFAIPQVLSLRHVPESDIASLTAIAFSPGFWAFLISPVLDVRFSRRWYSATLALIAALTLTLAMVNLGHLGMLELFLTIGFTAAYLFQSALSGWLSTITTVEEKQTLSVWLVVANVSGFSLMAVLCNLLVAHLQPLPVAVVLGILVLLPTLLFPLMPAPGPDRKLARESFGQFFRHIAALFRQRDVLLAILLFLTPAGTFSLTNFLGGLGADFHATPNFTSWAATAGALGGVVGCLLFPFLNRRLPLRPLYLTIGAVGACLTLLLILLPHTPSSFVLVLIAENLVQSLAITNSVAIAFAAIGQDNPLASTLFCTISSAFGVPISYMLYIDAFGFRRGGIAGSFAADAIAGLIACVLFAVLLLILARRRATQTQQV